MNARNGAQDLISDVKRILASPVEGTSILVTPDIAKLWLDKWQYSGQRKLRVWHRDNLAKMMQQGKFRRNTQISFMRLGESYFLTNGQHTLSAIVHSGIEQELSISINDAIDMDDVADDFSRHDTHLTRQFGDSLIAHGVHQDLGITATTLHTCVAAIIYYCWATGKVASASASLLTHDEKLSLVREYGELATITWNIFEGANNQLYFRRRTVLASAMFCANKSIERAESFFREIALDDGLRIGDPRKAILEWFRSHTSIRTNRSADVKTASDAEFVKAISVAWNAWIEGRDLKVIKIAFDSPDAFFKTIGKMQVRGRRK
jgi:hypothetical protein